MARFGHLLAEKIEINYESGEILFKHENDMKYPLFYLSGRARGIGTAPVMELGQTSFMALALKVGSFDTDEWTPEQQKKLSDELKKIQGFPENYKLYGNTTKQIIQIGNAIPPPLVEQILHQLNV